VNDLKNAVRDFLACRRIAVAGVSREGKQAANAIYRRLKASGHTVFATNPRAEEVEGETCYPDLRSIPGGVEAVVIATPPAAVSGIVQECVELGIRKVWLHRSFGNGSVSDEGVALARRHGIATIAGACPLMYCPPIDFGHRCMRTVLGLMGKLPAVR
jgi:predicted CoA-binding protein